MRRRRRAASIPSSASTKTRCSNSATKIMIPVRFRVAKTRLLEESLRGAAFHAAVERVAVDQPASRAVEAACEPPAHEAEL